MSAANGETISAAGAVPWRVRDGRLQVALIHRPRYGDWSWPKGKLDPDETWQAAAVREVWEETGLRVRLGAMLPEAHYRISGSRNHKHVRYWSAEITGGSGRLHHEVDEVRWAEPAAARKRLSYERDRDQLDAVVRAHRNKVLDVRPLVIVRHAKATPRRRWHSDDWLRPLDAQGHAQADAMVEVLLAYGIVRLLSSSSTRCVDTLRPYATATRQRLETSHALSEEGFEKRPKHAIETMRRQLSGRAPVAICSHGPVLPAMLSALATHAKGAARAALNQAAAGNLDKGEALVAQLDRRDRPVCVERIRPR